MAKKGTVTELSSLFPAEEVQKASLRVHGEIAERRRLLDQLEGFFDDNTNLINLVRRLPDETHHNIMVPFGKAAFFPGRMTNPNKFLVLLGEGYYAERSAKQTVEILRRRGKDLETQMESLKAIMQDLKLEASFFEKTADESAEGLVEIREDYIEEAPSGTSPISGDRKSDSVPLEVDNGEATVEDDEYSRIFARMAELEKEEEEEEEEEEANGSDQDERIQNEQDNSVRREVRSIPAVTREAPVVSKEGASHGNYPARSNAVANKELELPQNERIYPACSNAVANKELELPQDERKYPARSNAVVIKELELPQDDRDYPAHSNAVVNKDLERPQGERDHPASSNAVVNKDLELPQGERDHPARSNAVVNKDLEPPQVEKKTTLPPASNTAIIGSIVEHSHNIGANVPQQQAGARSSKPVSRFKMQRK